MATRTLKSAVEETQVEDSGCGADEEILQGMLKTKAGYCSGLVARKIMVELVRAERASFLLLREDDVLRWWQGEVNEQRKLIEARKERARVNKLKRAAIAKLSADERKALGIRVTKAMTAAEEDEA